MGAFASADRELATLAASAGLAWRAAVTEESTASPTPASPGPGSSAPADTPVQVDVRSLDVLLTDFAFDDPAAVAKAMVVLPVAALAVSFDRAG